MHLEPVQLHHVAVAEPLGAQPVRRVQRTHPTPHPLRELAGGLGVVGVMVRQEYDAHLARRLGDRVEVGQIDGPGSTTIDLRASGSRSTQVLVPSSVIMFALGASTHAARDPKDPPVQFIVPGNRERSRFRHSSDCQRSERLRQRQGRLVALVDELRREHVDGPVGGGREHLGRRTALPDLQDREVGRRQHQHRPGLDRVDGTQADSQVTDDDSVDTSRVRWPSGSSATKNQVR